MLRTLVIGIALCLGWNAEAIEYAAGQRYDAGQKVDISGIGTSFQIPQVWVGGVMEGAFVLGSETEPGALFLVPNMSQSIEQVRGWFREPMQIDESTVFVPASEAIIENGRLQIVYKVMVNGMETNEAFALVQGRLGPAGQFMAAVAIGQSAHRSTIVARQEELLNSVEFFPPKRPPELVGCWSNTDSSYTDGLSFSSSTRIELDAAGGFQYKEKSLSSYSGMDAAGDWAGAPSVEADDGERGRYHTVGSQLFLVDPNGEYREFIFGLQNGAMHFNGIRYGGC